MGTEPCGLPRDGLRLSLALTTSQVQSDGVRLNSVNHSHPPNPRTIGVAATRKTVRRLTLTAHLHCPALAKNRRRSRGIRRCTLDPDAVVAATETRVVPDGHREPRNSRVDEHSNDGGERAEQDHHLEAEDRIGNP